MVHLPSFSHTVRAHCLTQGLAFPLGHVQQLIAAALGHNTLAALQASSDLAAIDDADVLVVDSVLLETRAAALGLPAKAASAAVAGALQGHLGHLTVHPHSEAYYVELQAFIDDRTFNDGNVISEMAMANGGLEEIYMPLDLPETFVDDDEENVSVRVIGHIGLEQDPDRVYYGHKVGVEATLMVERVGKRIFTGATVEVQRARLWLFGEEEDWA